MPDLADLFDRLPWIRCTVAFGSGWHSFAAQTLEAVALLDALPEDELDGGVDIC